VFIDKSDDAHLQSIPAVVKQYLVSGRNWYLSVPVSGTQSNSVLNGTSAIYWDEPNGNWATATGNLSPTRGYISVATQSTGAISFSGNLNTGTFTVPLTRTPGKTKEGFNLVCNPYPSHLAWTEATAIAANVMSTIWYRTATYSSELSKYVYSFQTYNAPSGLGVPSDATGYIPPMQAFWVRVNPTTDGTETLTFTNEMRYDRTSNPLKAPSAKNSQQTMVRLRVANSVGADESVLYFNENALNGYDTYDSPKMMNNNASVPEIYTLAGTEQLVINGMNSLPLNTEIPLGFVTGESNTFSLSATEISNLPSDIRVMLKDGSMEYDLTDGGTYSFSSPVTSTSSRFSVIFKSAGTVTGVQNPAIDDKNLLVYCNANKHIVVESNAAAVVSVYNAVGQKLFTQNLISDKTELNSTFTPGVYMVVVNGVNRKVVVE